MKNSVKLIVGIAFLFISSCKKDDSVIIPDNIFGQWEATSFYSVESVTYSKKDGYNPKITFYESGAYGLDLDFSGCGGNFILTDVNNIKMNSPMCYEQCCDSDFSLKLKEMLSEVSNFTFDKNGNLKLNVDDWGYIELQKVN